MSVYVKISWMCAWCLPQGVDRRMMGGQTMAISLYNSVTCLNSHTELGKPPTQHLIKFLSLDLPSVPSNYLFSMPPCPVLNIKFDKMKIFSLATQKSKSSFSLKIYPDLWQSGVWRLRPSFPEISKLKIIKSRFKFSGTGPSNVILCYFSIESKS